MSFRGFGAARARAHRDLARLPTAGTRGGRGSTLASPVFLRSNRLPTHASNRAGRQVFAPAFQDGQVGPGSWPQSRQQVHTVPYSECCWCRPVGEVLPAAGSRPAVPARNAGPGESAQQCIDGMRRASAASTPAIGDDTAHLQRMPARACLPLPAVCILRTYSTASRCSPSVPSSSSSSSAACMCEPTDTSALSECGRGVGRTARSAPEKSNTAGPPAA